jgi:hypothetical protein
LDAGFDALLRGNVEDPDARVALGYLPRERLGVTMDFRS